MHYFVTYTTIDSEFGNPFWHAFIILSTFDEKGATTAHKIQVHDTWGFYGIPSTTRDGCLSKLKIKIGLDVDLVGNHGMLQHEEIRYLDLGRALHGISFELNEAQWNALQAKCHKMSEDQRNAVNEIAGFCGFEAKSRPRIYAYEQHSQLIHLIEKSKAAKEGRESRLKPFEIKWHMTSGGPTLRESRTCKSQILELLKDTLSEEQIHRLTEYNKHPTIPKYSGKTETIHLHSEGPLRTHHKKSGQIVHYRDIEDKETKLYWTFPPQLVETSNDNIKALFQIQKELQAPIKNAIKKLQAIEWLLINAAFPDHLLRYKSALLQTVKKHYESFALIDGSLPQKRKVLNKHNLFYLFNPSHHEESDRLRVVLRNAESFLNALYFAIVDNWEIDPALPLEIENFSSDTEDTPVEALAAYLAEKDKQSFCKILNRSYNVLPKDEAKMSIRS